MTLRKIKSITNGLAPTVMRRFEFNGAVITVNYAARAKHTKNWDVKPHYHPWFEFNYVSKGSACITIDNTEFSADAGMSYLIPPGVVHSNRSSSGDDGICIRFSIDFSNVLGEYSDLFSALCEPRTCAFDSGIEKVNPSGNVCAVQAEFAAWLMRIAGGHADFSRLESTDADMIITNQVKVYLEEYYASKISVENISSALNMSYRTLRKKLKNECGRSVSDILSEIRIDRAKRLLLTTDMTVYDIAAAVGYENEFYFSRKFKQSEHVSPLKYRKNVY